jgi:hypothetical protein
MQNQPQKSTQRGGDCGNMQPDKAVLLRRLHMLRRHFNEELNKVKAEIESLKK